MRTFLLAIFLILLLLTFPKLGSAQQSQGITVTPSILRLDLSQDKAEAELYYKNSTGAAIELSFFAQDFSELEESGRVKFLLEKDAKNYKYGLTSWIAFEKNSITLAPGQGQNIKIFINKDQLTAGGHYASILAEVKQSEKAVQLPVKALLSTLIFVRAATGNEHEEMSLQTISPIRTLIGFPDKFLVRLQNKGNVELIPFGLIEIRDIFGNVVAKGLVNEGSLITLAESVRRFDVPINRQTRFIPPGIYKASINVHFGKENKTLNQSVTFVSLGSINGLFLGVVVIGTLLIWKRKHLGELFSKPY